MASLRRVSPVYFGATLLFAIHAPHLAGQIRGVAIDESDTPLSGVTVELWSPTKRLAARITGTDGHFQFSEDTAEGAVGLLAHRIGSRAAHLPLPVSGALVVVRLVPEPIVIDGIMVTAHAESAVCPNRDDPAARAFWDAARRRYSGRQGSFRSRLELEFFESEGPRSTIGAVDDGRMQPGLRTTAPAGSGSWSEGMFCGYGCRIQQSFDPAFAAWRYPPLESHYTRHFISDAFGERHSFSVLSRDDEEVVLAFCSTERRSDRVRLEGSLRIANTGAVLDARWTYRTPRPREDAGAEVVFIPVQRFAGEPFLLPARSLYWRSIHGRSDRYFYRVERYGEWQLSADAATGTPSTEH